MSVFARKLHLAVSLWPGQILPCAAAHVDTRKAVGSLDMLILVPPLDEGTKKFQSGCVPTCREHGQEAVLCLRNNLSSRHIRHTLRIVAAC